jgi:hypothetical protein
VVGNPTTSEPAAAAVPMNWRRFSVALLFIMRPSRRG